MAAPVVPIQDARAVPMNKISVFTLGVPAKYPFKRIPPEIVKRANNNIIKGIYSKRKTCRNWWNASSKPLHIIKGSRKDIAQNADILPKFLCQNIGATNGTAAIDSNIPIKGMMVNNGNSSPRLPPDAKIELKRKPIINIFLDFINYFIRIFDSVLQSIWS